MNHVAGMTEVSSRCPIVTKGEVVLGGSRRQRGFFESCFEAGNTQWYLVLVMSTMGSGRVVPFRATPALYLLRYSDSAGDPGESKGILGTLKDFDSGCLDQTRSRSHLVLSDYFRSLVTVFPSA